MPDVREVYEMVTKQKPPAPGALERQQRRQVRSARNKKFGAFAVAAAIGLVAVALILVNRPGPNATTPVDEPATVNPQAAAAEGVARDFLEAYGSFDADEALTYVSDDADLFGLGGGTERFRQWVALLEAQGYEQRLDSCDASAVAVRCTFVFHLLGSDELGRGPFGDSSFDFTLRGGEIVRVAVNWNIDEFSPQMWEPFADWVSTTYPTDAAVMYTDSTLSLYRLTEESIRLWERRIREYVDVQLAGMAQIAERFMAARNAYDVERAMSLLADDGATVRLMSDNVMDHDMGTVRLNREELALALEAERLYGVRYESVECQPDRWLLSWTDAQISCSFAMDSRLRQIEGLSPRNTFFGIGIQDGRVTYLSFPWLNISWGPGGFHPTEFESFVMWLDREHPEAIDADDPMTGGGKLFRTGGQEWTLNLNRESLDLLAGYLDEYERSARR